MDTLFGEKGRQQISPCWEFKLHEAGMGLGLGSFPICEALIAYSFTNTAVPEKKLQPCIKVPKAWGNMQMFMGQLGLGPQHVPTNKTAGHVSKYFPTKFQQKNLWQNNRGKTFCHKRPTEIPTKFQRSKPAIVPLYPRSLQMVNYHGELHFNIYFFVYSN